MKQLYLIAVSFLLINLSFAAPIKGTINNGAWRNASTWDKNRKPENGDTIVIPADKIIVLTDQQILNNVNIQVYGTLKMTGFFSYLSINSASKIVVHSGGKIEATIDYLQYIIHGGNTIFYANSIIGPQQTTSLGFSSFNPMPVKFAGFTVTRKNAGEALIQWSTTEEQNADRFEIERSYDGNNWQMIAYVAAIGNSATLNNYSYTDKYAAARTVYYRIRQVDLDQRFVYSSVGLIRNEVKNSSINIASVQKKVLLQFPEQVKGNLVVRFVSLSGQVVDQQVIKDAIGQVVLHSKVTGNYVISVSNGQDLNVAKQVIL